MSALHSTPLVTVLLVAAGCASSTTHDAYASQDCTAGTACSATSVVGGGRGGGGGTAAKTVVDGGTVAAADAATTSGFTSCTTDPTTHSTLCLDSSQCAVRVDPVAFPGCGYEVGATNLTLACLCNGTQLCPIGVGTSCTNLGNQIATKTVAEICNQVSVAGACKDLGAIGPTGTGGGSGKCDQACEANCAGNLPCIIACGC